MIHLDPIDTYTINGRQFTNDKTPSTSFFISDLVDDSTIDDVESLVARLATIDTANPVAKLDAIHFVIHEAKRLKIVPLATV